MATTARVLRNNRVLRYTFNERIIHWAAGLSYIYSLLSGLAIWSPYLYWIAIFLGGGSATRYWHPWGGLIFCAAVVSMYRIWRPDMKVTATDREWEKTIGQYVRNEDEEMTPGDAKRAFEKWAPVDRFNLGQKYLFWLMFYGGLTLLLTGLVLWFTDYIPWSLRFLRYISVVLHPIAFLATLGGFIIHVYMGTAVVRGGFTSVIRGEVSDDWAKHHHRLWYERITGTSSLAGTSQPAVKK